MFLLLLVVAAVLLAVAAWYYWPQYHQGPGISDKETLVQTFSLDSIAHRTLMIECLTQTERSAGEATYQRLKEDTSSLSKPLTSLFGSVTAHKVVALLHKRNHLLKEYYLKVRQSPGTNVEQKLEELSRSIVDTIATSSQLHQVDLSHDKTLPLNRYQRLYNLLVIYDKEIINQVRSYLEQYYEISLNSSKSCFEIIRYIVEELVALVQERAVPKPR